MATSEVESDTDRKPLLTNGSFAYLLGQYGFEFKNYDVFVGYYTFNPNNDNYNVIQAPIYLLKNGNIDEVGVSRYGGEGTWQWSSTSASVEIAGNTRLYQSQFSPASVWYRMCGFSLCCWD